MILLNNVFLPLETDFSSLLSVAAKQLKIPKEKIISAKLHKKSVDARDKTDVKFCVSILVETSVDEAKIIAKNKKASIYKETVYKVPFCNKKINRRPVVVGFGPAGMFCALVLAKVGLKPIVIERGKDVDARIKDVQNFFNGETLNTESNVQFGEGGAGTFSDGKLNSGIKDIRCKEVLKIFVEHGAKESILYDSKPHIGTDVLRGIVKNIRNEIISLGGEVRFNTRLDDIVFKDSKVVAIVTNNCEKIETDALALCIGHSARDTFYMLKEKGVEMVKKPFSVGVRIEHLQSDINKALYGSFANHKSLGAADYKMAVHLENGRGVYTFCMCPGGEVVNASSEKNKIAVNGMSNSLRDGENANSALLVGIEPEDIVGEDVLAGCEFQRAIEENAYEIAKGGVPITTVGQFVFEKEPVIGKVKPTVLPRCEICDFKEIFPEFVIDSLKQGIIAFGRKIKGFDDTSALLTAPETRSSSPIRILRNENAVSTNFGALFPCGEGAGYAGGIMSAAVDGIKTAEAIVNSYNNE